MIVRFLIIVYVFVLFTLNLIKISAASLTQHDDWQWNDMNVITSAETKLIMNSNVFLCLMDQWALWSQGALISYVPYFDKTSDAPICDLFYYILLLVAVGRICEYWRFPSTNTKQKLSCCRFLCTVPYTKRYVPGGVSRKPTIRHNTDTSVECDNAFYFLHELLWCCSSDWTSERGKLRAPWWNVFVFLSLSFTYACFWNVALISPNFAWSGTWLYCCYTFHASIPPENSRINSYRWN